MNNDTNVVETTNTTDNALSEDYIKTIQDLKANSVDKDLYAKQVEENRKLLKALANNELIQTENSNNSKVNVETLRNELYSSNNNMTNLEYVEKTLELRKALIEQGKLDPFLPVGREIDITKEDIEKADKTAKNLSEMVEIAYESGNDPNIVFTELLKQRVVDNNSMRYRR